MRYTGINSQTERLDLGKEVMKFTHSFFSFISSIDSWCCYIFSCCCSVFCPTEITTDRQGKGNIFNKELKWMHLDLISQSYPPFLHFYDWQIRLLLVVLMYPGFILIDHGHFQYPYECETIKWHRVLFWSMCNSLSVIITMINFSWCWFQVKLIFLN